MKQLIMPEKASSWYIALTYSITSGVISGFLQWFLSIPVLLLGVSGSIPMLVLDLILFLGVLIIIWYSTKYASKVVERKYIILNKQRVIIFSLGYYFIALVILLYGIIASVNIAILALTAGIVFYFGSRRHLSENSGQEVVSRNKNKRKNKF